MRVAIITLGCAKNSVDSSRMRASIERGGGTVVDDANGADIIIINTCGFIESARRESIETILDAATVKEGKRQVKLVVTGCMVERYASELAEELHEVDFFVDLAAEADIGSIIETGAQRMNKGDPEKRYAPRERYVSGPAEYLMIADGCSNRCSFCAIPLIRGPYRSSSMEELVVEAGDLAAAGAKELTLVGQDTTAYGLDTYGKRSLPELLDRLAEIDGIEWLRVMYAQPLGVDDDLIAAIARIEKVNPYIDLPLQHASDRIIASMRRWGGKRQYLDLIERLRVMVPGIAIRTSIIAGYPGESEGEFEELAEFLRDANLDYVGVFEFSPEEGVEAATLPDRLDSELVSERARELCALRDDMIHEKAAKRVGREANVLIEAVEDGYSIGRATWQAPEVDGNVHIDGETRIGSILQVEIIDADGGDYEAKPVLGPGE